MLVARSLDNQEPELIRQYYASGYTSLSDFLTKHAATDMLCCEAEPSSVYEGPAIAKKDFGKDFHYAKDRLLKHACSLLSTSDPIYIEFGVRMGRSMNIVATEMKAPKATLFGLDTFTGLPEGWVSAWGNRGGKVSSRSPGDMAVTKLPETNDHRVVLIKGLFQDTLPIILPHLGHR